MASFQNTFRKSGSHNAESHSLQGVQVKIGEMFRPPKKVTLPVGWQDKDPSVVLSLMYDFSLEKEVISKAEALRTKQQEQLKTTDIESQVRSTSVDTVHNQNAVFSNVGSEILQPVVAERAGHKKKDSFGGKGKNAFDLADFEGDTSTPFELVELQTINDLDELKNVLQPGAKTPLTSFNNRTPAQAVASTNKATDIPHQSRNSLVDISVPSYVEPTSLSDTRPLASTSCGDCSVQGGLSNHNITPGGSFLVDIGDSNNESSQMSSAISATTASSTSTSPLSSSSTNLDSRPVSRGGLLPPLGSGPPPVPPRPQPRQPLQTSTHVTDSSQSHNRGIYTVPDSTSAKGKHLTYIYDNQGQYGPPVSVSSSRESRSPESQIAVGRYPSPLPPIGLSSEEPRNHLATEKHVSTYQSSLPDVWPILTDSEISLVKNIASMGFPTPRVARGVQRIGLKEGEVIEFLVAVDALCEAGYEPDLAEVAVGLNNSEKAKAVEFLKLVKTFKEYGFEEESILESLRAADNDSEKALEYLMTLSTS